MFSNGKECVNFMNSKSFFGVIIAFSECITYNVSVERRGVGYGKKEYNRIHERKN